MDQHRVRSTVDRPPWSATELDGAGPSGRSGAQQPTGGGATGRGVHGESIFGLTRARAERGGRVMAVKKWWRRHLVRATLGRGEKRRRAGRGAVENSDGW
jgi:hypothetical protein